MNKNKNSKMTPIYRITSASYDFLGQYPLKAFSKLLFQNTARLTYLCEKKNRDEGSQHSSVFSGLKTFNVEPPLFLEDVARGNAVQF